MSSPSGSGQQLPNRSDDKINSSCDPQPQHQQHLSSHEEDEEENDLDTFPEFSNTLPSNKHSNTSNQPGELPSGGPLFIPFFDNPANDSEPSIEEIIAFGHNFDRDGSVSPNFHAKPLHNTRNQNKTTNTTNNPNQYLDKHSSSPSSPSFTQLDSRGAFPLVQSPTLPSPRNISPFNTSTEQQFPPRIPQPQHPNHPSLPPPSQPLASTAAISSNTSGPNHQPSVVYPSSGSDDELLINNVKGHIAIGILPPSYSHLGSSLTPTTPQPRISDELHQIGPNETSHELNTETSYESSNEQAHGHRQDAITPLSAGGSKNLIKPTQNPTVPQLAHSASSRSPLSPHTDTLKHLLSPLPLTTHSSETFPAIAKAPLTSFYTPEDDDDDPELRAIQLANVGRLAAHGILPPTHTPTPTPAPTPHHSFGEDSDDDLAQVAIQMANISRIAAEGILPPPRQMSKHTVNSQAQRQSIKRSPHNNNRSLNHSKTLTPAMRLRLTTDQDLIESDSETEQERQIQRANVNRLQVVAAGILPIRITHPKTNKNVTIPTTPTVKSGQSKAIEDMWSHFHTQTRSDANLPSDHNDYSSGRQSMSHSTTQSPSLNKSPYEKSLPHHEINQKKSTNKSGESNRETNIHEEVELFRNVQFLNPSSILPLRQRDIHSNSKSLLYDDDYDDEERLSRNAEGLLASSILPFRNEKSVPSRVEATLDFHNERGFGDDSDEELKRQQELNAKQMRAESILAFDSSKMKLNTARRPSGTTSPGRTQRSLIKTKSTDDLSGIIFTADNSSGGMKASQSKKSDNSPKRSPNRGSDSDDDCRKNNTGMLDAFAGISFHKSKHTSFDKLNKKQQEQHGVVSPIVGRTGDQDTDPEGRVGATANKGAKFSPKGSTNKSSDKNSNSEKHPTSEEEDLSDFSDDGDYYDYDGYGTSDDLRHSGMRTVSYGWVKFPKAEDKLPKRYSRRLFFGRHSDTPLPPTASSEIEDVISVSSQTSRRRESIVSLRIGGEKQPPSTLRGSSTRHIFVDQNRHNGSKVNRLLGRGARGDQMSVNYASSAHNQPTTSRITPSRPYFPQSIDPDDIPFNNSGLPMLPSTAPTATPPPQIPEKQSTGSSILNVFIKKESKELDRSNRHGVLPTSPAHLHTSNSNQLTPSTPLSPGNIINTNTGGGQVTKLIQPQHTTLSPKPQQVIQNTTQTPSQITQPPLLTPSTIPQQYPPPPIYKPIPKEIILSAATSPTLYTPTQTTSWGQYTSSLDYIVQQVDAGLRTLSEMMNPSGSIETKHTRSDSKFSAFGSRQQPSGSSSEEIPSHIWSGAFGCQQLLQANKEWADNHSEARMQQSIVSGSNYLTWTSMLRENFNFLGARSPASIEREKDKELARQYLFPVQGTAFVTQLDRAEEVYKLLQATQKVLRYPINSSNWDVYFPSSGAQVLATLNERRMQLTSMIIACKQEEDTIFKTSMRIFDLSRAICRSYNELTQLYQFQQILLFERILCEKESNLGGEWETRGQAARGVNLLNSLVIAVSESQIHTILDLSSLHDDPVSTTSTSIPSSGRVTMTSTERMPFVSDYNSLEDPVHNEPNDDSLDKTNNAEQSNNLTISVSGFGTIPSASRRASGAGFALTNPMSNHHNISQFLSKTQDHDQMRTFLQSVKFDRGNLHGRVVQLKEDRSNLPFLLPDQPVHFFALEKPVPIEPVLPFGIGQDHTKFLNNWDKGRRDKTNNHGNGRESNSKQKETKQKSDASKRITIIPSDITVHSQQDPHSGNSKEQSRSHSNTKVSRVQNDSQTQRFVYLDPMLIWGPSYDYKPGNLASIKSVSNTLEKRIRDVTRSLEDTVSQLRDDSFIRSHSIKRRYDELGPQLCTELENIELDRLESIKAEAQRVFHMVFNPLASIILDRIIPSGPPLGTSSTAPQYSPGAGQSNNGIQPTINSLPPPSPIDPEEVLNDPLISKLFSTPGHGLGELYRLLNAFSPKEIIAHYSTQFIEPTPRIQLYHVIPPIVQPHDLIEMLDHPPVFQAFDPQISNPQMPPPPAPVAHPQFSTAKDVAVIPGLLAPNRKHNSSSKNLQALETFSMKNHTFLNKFYTTSPDLIANAYIIDTPFNSQRWMSDKWLELCDRFQVPGPTPAPTIHVQHDKNVPAVAAVAAVSASSEVKPPTIAPVDYFSSKFIRRFVQQHLPIDPETDTSKNAKSSKKNKNTNTSFESSTPLRLGHVESSQTDSGSHTQHTSASDYNCSDFPQMANLDGPSNQLPLWSVDPSGTVTLPSLETFFETIFCDGYNYTTPSFASGTIFVEVTQQELYSIHNPSNIGFLDACRVNPTTIQVVNPYWAKLASNYPQTNTAFNGESVPNNPNPANASFLSPLLRSSTQDSHDSSNTKHSHSSLYGLNQPFGPPGLAIGGLNTIVPQFGPPLAPSPLPSPTLRSQYNYETPPNLHIAPQTLNTLGNTVITNTHTSPFAPANPEPTGLSMVAIKLDQHAPASAQSRQPTAGQITLAQPPFTHHLTDESEHKPTQTGNNSHILVHSISPPTPLPISYPPLPLLPSTDPFSSHDQLFNRNNYILVKALHFTRTVSTKEFASHLLPFAQPDKYPNDSVDIRQNSNPTATTTGLNMRSRGFTTSSQTLTRAQVLSPPNPGDLFPPIGASSQIPNNWFNSPSYPGNHCPQQPSGISQAPYNAMTRNNSTISINTIDSTHQTTHFTNQTTQNVPTNIFNTISTTTPQHPTNRQQPQPGAMATYSQPHIPIILPTSPIQPLHTRHRSNSHSRDPIDTIVLSPGITNSHHHQTSNLLFNTTGSVSGMSTIHYQGSVASYATAGAQGTKPFALPSGNPVYAFIPRHLLTPIGRDEAERQPSARTLIHGLISPRLNIALYSYLCSNFAKESYLFWMAVNQFNSTQWQLNSNHFNPSNGFAFGSWFMDVHNNPKEQEKVLLWQERARLIKHHRHTKHRIIRDFETQQKKFNGAVFDLQLNPSTNDQNSRLSLPTPLAGHDFTNPAPAPQIITSPRATNSLGKSNTASTTTPISGTPLSNNTIPISSPLSSVGLEAGGNSAQLAQLNVVPVPLSLHNSQQSSHQSGPNQNPRTRSNFQIYQKYLTINYSKEKHLDFIHSPLMQTAINLVRNRGHSIQHLQQYIPKMPLELRSRDPLLPLHKTPHWATHSNQQGMMKRVSQVYKSPIYSVSPENFINTALDIYHSFIPREANYTINIGHEIYQPLMSLFALQIELYQNWCKKRFNIVFKWLIANPEIDPSLIFYAPGFFGHSNSGWGLCGFNLQQQTPCSATSNKEQLTLPLGRRSSSNYAPGQLTAITPAPTHNLTPESDIPSTNIDSTKIVSSSNVVDFSGISPLTSNLIPSLPQFDPLPIIIHRGIFIEAQSNIYTLLTRDVCTKFPTQNDVSWYLNQHESLMPEAPAGNPRLAVGGNTTPASESTSLLPLQFGKLSRCPSTQHHTSKHSLIFQDQVYPMGLLNPQHHE